MEKLQIKKNSLSEQICKILEAQIASGEIPVGSRLPSENVLAENFGVSRLSVRLAIQKLNAMGVVHTKQGSGTYVIQFDYEKYLSDASILFENSDTLNDVTDFRAMLEPAAAALAIERATEEEYEKLEHLCQEHAQARRNKSTDRETWLKKVASIDLSIHEQICKMSHNQLFICAFAMAKESIHQYMLFCLFKCNPSDSESQNLEDRPDFHHAVYEAMQEKDHERCKKLLLQMISSYGQRL